MNSIVSFVDIYYNRIKNDILREDTDTQETEERETRQDLELSTISTHRVTTWLPELFDF